MVAITYKILILFFSFLFLSTAILARSGEVDDEREFSYDTKSANGPANWGNIKPEWSTCKTGKRQSPIDIPNKEVDVVSNLGILQTDYKPSNATLLNRCHDIMVRWEGGGGYLKINGTQYQLIQFHWHTPSEHTIDGQRFNLEGHLVHESIDGKIAVIGILYKIGLWADPFISRLEKDLKVVAHTKEVERAIGIIDPNLINVDGKKYYRYIGSLTTPPCTEHVVWTIDKKVKSITWRQMKLLQEAVHDDSETNARPIQPRNNRPIQLYKPQGWSWKDSASYALNNLLVL